MITIASIERIAMSIAAVAAVAALAAPACGNELDNPSFETTGPNGPSTEFVGLSGGGWSAAENWGIFHNTEGTTTTELVGSDLVGGGERMLRVVTDGAYNGLVQVMGPMGTGPTCVEFRVWVFVVSGGVLIGAGNGGNTGPNAYSQTTGQWEELVGHNSVCPVNEVIIYSDNSPGLTEFFVDLASVEVLDCPGPAGDLDGDGFVGFGDLVMLLGNWGPCAAGAPCAGDLDGDLDVDFTDLTQLLATWGTC